MSAAVISRALPSTTAALALRSAARPQLAAFSTSRAAMNTNPNGNPELPSFSFKHITSNPRTRRILIGGFMVLAAIEGYGWYTFAPKVWGGKNGEETEE